MAPVLSSRRVPACANAVAILTGCLVTKKCLPIEQENKIIVSRAVYKVVVLCQYPDPVSGASAWLRQDRGKAAEGAGGERGTRLGQPFCRRMIGRSVIAASNEKAAATAGRKRRSQISDTGGSESTGKDQSYRLVRTAGETDLLTTPGVAAFSIGLLAQ